MLDALPPCETGGNHAEIAVVLNNLGSLFQASSRPERAEEYYRGCVAHEASSARRRPCGSRRWPWTIWRRFSALRAGPPLHVSGFGSCFNSRTIRFGRLHPVTRCIRANHELLRVRVSEWAENPIQKMLERAALLMAFGIGTELSW